jgi:hypothetical protein
MKKQILVLAVVSLLLAGSAWAEKLKGYLSEASASSIVVDGQTIRIGPDTTIERTRASYSTSCAT